MALEPVVAYIIVLVSLLVGGGIVVAVKLLYSSRLSCSKAALTANTLLKHHTHMVAITDQTGMITSTSDFFDDSLAWRNPEELAVSFPELIDDKDRGDYHKILQYLDREKKPLVDYQIRLKVNHTERELGLTVVPVLDSSGHILSLIHLLRPANDNNELAANLGHLEKLTNIGQITAGMAHELNTPLGAILLSADIISEKLGTKHSVSEEVAKIKARADHCSKVVKQLLSYARKDEYLKSRLDIRTVIERVKALVAGDSKKRKITIDIHSAPNESVILCNENQIEQLFFNLVSNAFHAIGRDGRIVMQIGYDELLRQVTVSFADDGCGIPPEQIEKIFDPFFTTKSSTEGTGLGLALCKKIILEHDGRIEVNSVVSHGTTFKLSFPAVE